MGGNDRFWTFFGAIWFIVGVGFLATSLSLMLLVDPAALNPDVPLWPFLVVGSVCSGAGAAVIYAARTAAERERVLMQSGIPLTAAVTQVERSPLAINRQPRWHVVYRYEYAQGRPLSGRSRALASEAVQGFRPGDRVRIKVNPQRPEESLFLGAA